MGKAKVVMNQNSDHRLTIEGDYGGEVILVRGGPLRAYLWIGDKEGYMNETIGSEKVLRALAEAILAELDAKPTLGRCRKLKHPRAE